MKIIRDTKLFNDLKEASKKGKSIWEVLFDKNFELKNKEILFFASELDHIKETKNQFVFHDRGSNGKDNSFIIRKEKNW